MMNVASMGHWQARLTPTAQRLLGQSRLEQLGVFAEDVWAWGKRGMATERMRCVAPAAAASIPALVKMRRSAPPLGSLYALMGSSCALQRALLITGGALVASTSATLMLGVITALNGVMGIEAVMNNAASTNPWDKYIRWGQIALATIDGIGLGVTLGALLVGGAATSVAAALVGLGLWCALAVCMNHNMAVAKSSQTVTSTQVLASTLATLLPALAFGLTGHMGAFAACQGAMFVGSLSVFEQALYQLYSSATVGAASSSYAEAHVVDPALIAAHRLEAGPSGGPSVFGLPHEALDAWRKHLLKSQAVDDDGLRYWSGMPALTLLGPRGAGHTAVAYGLAQALEMDVVTTSGARLHDADTAGIQDMAQLNLRLLMLEAEERARTRRKPQMVLLEQANLFIPALQNINTREGLISVGNLMSFAFQMGVVHATRHSIVWVLTSDSGALGVDTLPLLNAAAPILLPGLDADGRISLAYVHAARLQAWAQANGLSLDDDFDAKLFDERRCAYLKRTPLQGRTIVQAMQAGRASLLGDAAGRTTRVLEAIDRALVLPSYTPVPRRAQRKPRPALLEQLMTMAGAENADLLGFVGAYMQITAQQSVASVASPQASMVADAQRNWCAQALGRRCARMVEGRDRLHVKRYNDSFMRLYAPMFFDDMHGVVSSSEAEAFFERHHANVLFPSFGVLEFFGAALVNGNGPAGLILQLHAQQHGRRKLHFLLNEPSPQRQPTLFGVDIPRGSFGPRALDGFSRRRIDAARLYDSALD